jgi:hypothetical protein
LGKVGPPCLNCHHEIPPEEGRLFAGVLVCANCFALAERLHERSLHELSMLQVMVRESIRIALVEGRLQFATGHEGEVPKRDVLRAVVQLLEKRHADRDRPDAGDTTNQPPEDR